jgi:hypothetical protein
MYLQKVMSRKIIFCLHPEGHCGKYQDPEPDLDPDPLPKCQGSGTLLGALR